ncbi:MAG TPA: aldehyde dehydrogenase family protein [Cellulomonas sp.]
MPITLPARALPSDPAVGPPPEAAAGACAGAERVAVVDPSWGRGLASFAPSGPAQVAAAVGAALDAAATWAAIGLDARIAALDALMAELLDRTEQIAVLEAADSGNPVAACRRDLVDVAAKLRHWSAMARTLPGTRYPGPGLHVDTARPYGVVARVTAYNKPFMFAASCAWMPLLTGNAVLLKPSPATSLSSLLLAEVAARHLPAGLLEVLLGGPSVVAALVGDPRVRRVSVIGSVPAGLAVQRLCANSGQVKHLTMELGGKNAMVVGHGVDVPAVADACVEGLSLRTTSGQSCQATTRLLVHEDVHDALVEAVAERVRAVRLGPATDEASEMGPMISAEHRDRVDGFVARAVADGAVPVVDGRRPRDVPDGGFYTGPSVLDGVAPGAELAREEVFGPVLAVTAWHDAAEAVALANAVRYGLTASLWTNDLTEAFALAGGVQAGYVWLNDVARHHLGTPFGGIKDSGTGSEEDEMALRSFQVRGVLHAGGRRG